MTTRLLALSALALLAGCATADKKKKKAKGSDDYRVPPARVDKARTVRFTSTDGRFVGLSDGSMWNIDWRHADRVSSWRPGTTVQVRQAGGGSFPYRLSTSDGSSAAARYGKKLD